MKILTANLLSTGEAVWLSANGRWATAISQSDIARDDVSEARLESRGKASLARHEVVDVNLVEIALHDGNPLPLRLRERIRAAGPTNRLDLGKQADARLVAAA
ncbi:MAG: DUF2849 domain-containing protein [Rhizobiaceae bacterium]